ncbi:alpha-amylase [Natronolimnobius sp. AArcel1]|uniref:alpha-amylase family glycosyl hydrolase n=1 Tax=Natronolimnobius sp. AArcel1 TaxID=1679093 RepID=UPI0013EDD970|nr:alpha-amylase family glycosyl hydrolase [Natronolimnobius sp. AArcel1]NGM69570.1 alpha-amylase [Natronolimnobius sp. AArcel1]
MTDRDSNSDRNREQTTLEFESGDGSSHPGPPRFVTVGESFVNPNGNDMETRDELAPWNPRGDASYSWHVRDAPADSSATPTAAPITEFVPDVPGTYTLALEAPDGTHELTVRAFPEADERAPRPQVSLEATVTDDQIALEATATVTDGSDADLEVEYYVDDRDEATISADGTIPTAEITEPVRVYAVAVGERHSVPDALELVPDESANAGVRLEQPFEAPTWVENALVYEIFTRRFPDQDEPTFQTIADRLDHLESLGVDVLWLTPFLEAESGFGTPMDRGGPHGYNTRDYFSPDSDLGSLEDLEALVEACHDREIRVVFDLVINHTSETHPFYEAAVDSSHPDHERYRDWYRWEDTDEREPDTYFGWDGIPNLDHSNPAVREYLLEVIDFWAPKVDGFRTDVAWGVPLGFWTEVHDRLTSADTDFFLLDETLPSDVDMGGGRFHMHHDDVLHDTLEAIGEWAGAADAAGTTDAGDADAGQTEIKAEAGATDEEDAVADEFTDSAAGIDTASADAILEAVAERDRRGGHPDSLWLQYVENHDTDRYLTQYGRDAQKAAAAATFTLPGVPMVYYGQETGLETRREPMNWGAFDDDLHTYYEQLSDLRRTHSALQTDATLERIEYDTETDAAVAYAREDKNGTRVIVVLHFGEGEATVRFDEAVAETDLVTGSTVTRADTAASEGLSTGVTVDTVAVLEVTDADA